MSRIYRATFVGFTGASFSVDVHAYTLAEATAECEAHMCAGDCLTVEELAS